LPLDTSTLPTEEEIAGQDPDNPIDDTSFVGRLTITARIDQQAGTVVPSYGAEDNARILENCRKFFGGSKYDKYEGPVWYLEAEGISVVRTDGQPFRQSEMLKLQSKAGRNLGKSQAHAAVGQQFLDHGVSGSYAKAGQDGSAYGRIFEFVSHKIGKGDYAKGVRMWPAQLFPVDYVYDGEVREVTPKTQDDEGAPQDGGSSVSLSEPEAIEVLKEILNGKTPSQMMDIILGDARLKNVPTVFGVPLVESATDESLATVLQENKVMAINGSGALAAIA
jgi:hypothetical protein